MADDRLAVLLAVDVRINNPGTLPDVPVERLRVWLADHDWWRTHERPIERWEHRTLTMPDGIPAPARVHWSPPDNPHGLDLWSTLNELARAHKVGALRVLDEILNHEGDQ